MDKWKDWLICYAVKYKDGHIEEKRATVKGRYMVTALGTALCDRRCGHLEHRNH